MSFTKACPPLLCLALLLVSCGGRNQYEYLDTKAVRIEKISHVEDGPFLVVTAVLRNDSSSAVENPVYRMEWYGDDDMLLEKSSWRPLIVKGGDRVRVTERSTVPGAREYTLIISSDAR
jgi:uncharacterized protein YcfL